MDCSQLVCAHCQWKYPLQSRVGHFEGQSLESVACPQCHALALQVISARRPAKRIPGRPAYAAHRLSARETNA